AGTHSGTAGNRLAPALSRARAWLRRSKGARRPGERRYGRGRAVRTDRGRSGLAERRERLVDGQPARGAQPRGTQGDAASWPGRDPADSDRLRTVPVGRPAAWRHRGGADARVAPATAEAWRDTAGGAA